MPHVSDPDLGASQARAPCGSPIHCECPAPDLAPRDAGACLPACQQKPATPRPVQFLKSQIRCAVFASYPPVFALLRVSYAPDHALVCAARAPIRIGNRLSARLPTQTTVHSSPV